MNLNKKALMLVPFVGLLLTSCNKWSVVTKEKAYDIRDNIHYYLVPPKSWHAAYDGGKYVVSGKEYTIEGDNFAYDYNNCYMCNKSIDAYTSKIRSEYYVVIDNIFYNLVDDGTEKYREKISDDPASFRTIFEANCVGQAKSLLMNIFIGGTLEGEVTQVEAMQELAKQDPEHFKANYEFTSSNDTSLRFTYDTHGEMEVSGATMSQDSKCDAKIENGLIRYADMSMKMNAGGEEATLLSGTIRYQYNNVKIPEFNLEDWPEQQ